MSYIKQFTHVYPEKEKKDISTLVAKNVSAYGEKEYELIFEQTGIGEAGVRNLKSSLELMDFQRIYFEEVECKYTSNSPIFSEEYVVNPTFKFTELEDGDILITNCSHVLSWRNGHAAIVSDAQNGKTIEAVVIGQNSTIQNISKWYGYPNIQVLRLKNATQEERSEIAKSAYKYLVDMPYKVLSGIYPKKYSDVEVTTGTQCAHLVWTAYAAHGYDIDSNKGLIVTPEDISKSEILEVVQIYGV